MTRRAGRNLPDADGNLGSVIERACSDQDADGGRRRAVAVVIPFHSDCLVFVVRLDDLGRLIFAGTGGDRKTSVRDRLINTSALREYRSRIDIHPAYGSRSVH